MDNRKQAIINALRVFVNQRPGFELGNYSTMADYRQDSRRATRQKAEALQLLRDIELRDSITAEAILKEAESGRVTLKDIRATYDDGSIYHKFSVNYCTGQYFCTEFRGAVARLAASVLWTWKREQCMPRTEQDATGGTFFPVRNLNGLIIQKVSPGDWLRANFRREYGRTLSARYFD